MLSKLRKAKPRRLSSFWLASRLLTVITLLATTSAFSQNVVNVVSAEKNDIIFLMGRTQYKKHYPILSNFDGLVKEIFVQAGEKLIFNQPLVRLKPFDPNKKTLEVLNETSDSHVISIQLKEGQKILEYETVMVLARSRDIMIEAYALETYITKFYLSQKVNVLLDVGGADFSLNGIISAIHEVEHHYPAALKLEINLNIDQCLLFSECKRLLRPGVLTKVEVSS